MKRLEKFLLGIIIGGTLMFFLTTLTSCRTGYGCRGKESWKGMERRINRPY
jgi:hypothetical protein